MGDDCTWGHHEEWGMEPQPYMGPIPDEDKPARARRNFLTARRRKERRESNTRLEEWLQGIRRAHQGKQACLGERNMA